MLPWPIRRNTYVGKLNLKFKGLKLYLQLWNSPASYWICEHFLLTNLYTSNQWHVSSTNFKGSFLLSRPSEHVFQEISRFFNFIFDDVSHLVLWGRGLRKSCSEQNPFAQIISFFLLFEVISEIYAAILFKWVLLYSFLWNYEGMPNFGICRKL